MRCVWVEWDDEEALWARWGAKGNISRDVFDAYFDGREEGLAIPLSKPRAFKEGETLMDLDVSMAHRGYVYLSRFALGSVMANMLE